MEPKDDEIRIPSFVTVSTYSNLETKSVTWNRIFKAEANWETFE